MDQPRVDMQNISKSFGGIHALKEVSLKVKAGEIHALVGENGAGKSTLMKILSGAYQKDSGVIKINGQTASIPSPHAGRKLGIGTIYQEFALAPDLTVAENIFLDHLGSLKGFIHRKKLYAKASELINRLGFDIQPQRLVGQLSIAYQQVVEICKALSQNAEILILDEPTAVLSPTEAEKLFITLKKLQSQGVAIIYISHRLEEIFQIADTISILKDGQITGQVCPDEVTTDQIIQRMIGRQITSLFPERKNKVGDKILSINRLTSEKKIEDISFDLHAGEILGFAGLVGSGRTETARAIFGADRIDQGTIHYQGKPIHIKSPTDALKAGIGLIPEDRKHQGAILPLPIEKNISLPSLWRNYQTAGLINQSKETKDTIDYIQKLKIKTSGPKERVENLSGGNQQKVVLAKWLGGHCSVLIFDEPTRGVDVGAKAEIYQLIQELAQQGLGIIIISSEMIELIGLCNRAIVMREGRIQGELQQKELSEENIMKLAIMKQTA